MEASPEDVRSWSDWFRRHGARLLVCARAWTRCTADAEDVVQDGFLRFWRHQRHLAGDPLALVLTSVRRAAIDLARATDRRALREVRAGSGEDTWFELPAMPDDGQAAELEAALHTLSADQREVVALKIWGELTFEQIGQQLDLSPNTAASRYRYALAALRTRLNRVSPASSAPTPSTCHG